MVCLSFIFRQLPQDVGLAQIATKIEEHEIGGLLIIGGFEVSILYVDFSVYSLISYSCIVWGLPLLTRYIAVVVNIE